MPVTINDEVLVRVLGAVDESPRFTADQKNGAVVTQIVFEHDAEL